MEQKEKIEPEKKFALPSPPPQSVAVAINGKRKSKYVVKWALDKFSTEENILFKLLHIHQKITAVPTPMGNSLPISQVRDDVVAAYRKEIEWQITAMLLPYKRMFTQRKVQVDILMIESEDVATAIAEEVTKGTIKKLVIGATSSGLFRRKLKGRDLTSKISECIPVFCTVYVVSKGKLSSVRPSDLETNASTIDGGSDTSSITSSSGYTSSLHTDLSSATSFSHFHSQSLPLQRFQALSTINQAFLHIRADSVGSNHSRSKSGDIFEREDVLTTCSRNSDVGPEISPVSSCRSSPTDDYEWMSDQASTSEAPADSSLESQVNINVELEKLRIELRHIRGMYAIAQTETIDASKKLNDLNKRRIEDATKLKEINCNEERAKELARQEREKYEAATREADYVRERAEREASQRRDAERKAAHDAKEKEKLQNALVDPVQQYQEFTWEEIVAATSSFSENFKIGMGSYGTVYKCSLHHTTAAVKVLHSSEGQRIKQFQQEIEILSRVRHPHLLLLLGACSDHGCLIYEYMENGSLEERLLRRNNTPPILWFDRYRIAWEVASTLVFLHNSKPKPIIHRDLKPANILLDHNFVSKIGDVGLSTMLQVDPISLLTMYNDTGPVGTLCYIDPEYQRTGLISPTSDVYAFGMVILQLLTGKPAIALAHVVETAINDGRIAEILDTDAGQWPIEETKELAILGLSCAEIRRKDRPDLKDQVLPALLRLKEVADRARDASPSLLSATPNHFVCPILKEVMNDPCVAADGYTYDRKAIETWLEDNDKSPMTNLPLPSKNLIPNNTILSAIMDWKSKR